MTMRDDDIANAIRQRRVDLLIKMFFDGNQPQVKLGFKTETELWDYKFDCPRPGSHEAWADLARHILGFHNKRGGLIFFGVHDKTFEYSGTSFRYDSKSFNEQIRKYLSDRLWVEFHREFIGSNQIYLGIVLIPPRGALVERFIADAPFIDRVQMFKAGDSAIREGDSTKILLAREVEEIERKESVYVIGQKYSINEPFYRILQPEYEEFVVREIPCDDVWKALHDPRTSIASVVGIGGVGKTSLATWAVTKAYENKLFDFIVSITAKDRELTQSGIKALSPGLTTFDSLLNSILDVLDFPDLVHKDIVSKEKEVRSLLENSRGLLYVDNLETVDDARVINFLDSLPLGARAIVTSRRAAVHVAVKPIDPGPMTEEEIIHFMGTLSKTPRLKYVERLSKAERIKVGQYCNGIPLAMRWTALHCKSAEELSTLAKALNKGQESGDELLEFSFRRVFEQFLDEEKRVLELLSLFQNPLPTEAILVASTGPRHKTLDAVEGLVADAMIRRVFDPQLNDYAYSLMPIVRTFAYKEVAKNSVIEDAMRRSLSDWYEARDIKDVNERLLIREIRQGKESSDVVLTDMALAAEKRGEQKTAENLFNQALQRNPTSWRAARLFGEYFRKLRNTSKALQYYEMAATNAPRRGPDRALIYREWGMILKNSGDILATDLAIEKFETALKDTPHDVLAIHALAMMYDRKGVYARVISLLSPLVDHSSRTTKKFALPILLKAYQKTGAMLKVVHIKQKMEDEKIEFD